jgi:hypothetical protein
MSEEQQDGEDKGFKVTDRRRFEADGSHRDEPDESGESGTAGDHGRALPDIDFSTFVLSLSTSVMVHLGETPRPDGDTRRDLGLAKQTIDILAMLKEKTSGNLSAEEARLLDELLFDLRLRYVSASK